MMLFGAPISVLTEPLELAVERVLSLVCVDFEVFPVPTKSWE